MTLASGKASGASACATQADALAGEGTIASATGDAQDAIIAHNPGMGAWSHGRSAVSGDASAP